MGGNEETKEPVKCVECIIMIKHKNRLQSKVCKAHKNVTKTTSFNKPPLAEIIIQW